MVKWFARKVFPPGPDTLAKGCGDLGSFGFAVCGVWSGRGGACGINRSFKAIVKDLYDCEKRVGRGLGWGVFASSPGCV